MRVVFTAMVCDESIVGNKDTIMFVCLLFCDYQSLLDHGGELYPILARHHGFVFAAMAGVCDEFTWVQLKLRLFATWRDNLLGVCDEFTWVQLKLRLSATWRDNLLGTSSAMWKVFSSRVTHNMPPPSQPQSSIPGFHACANNSSPEIKIGFRLLGKTLGDYKTRLSGLDRSKVSKTRKLDHIGLRAVYAEL
nr:hypothetical protein CTI12_AA229210 [Tanacetum cinerariifolium]